MVALHMGQWDGTTWHSSGIQKGHSGLNQKFIQWLTMVARRGLTLRPLGRKPHTSLIGHGNGLLSLGHGFVFEFVLYG